MASTFLSKFSTVNYLDILLAFGIALLVGLFICMIYKITFAGVMYSRSFALSLVAMTMITNVAILAVTQSVILSLGMVGALSIVRFRAAVKEPMEIAFLFWAISEGIVIGAGMFPVALIGAVLIGAVLYIFSLIGGRTPVTKPYILVLHAKDDAAEEAAQKQIAASVKKQAVKAKTVTAAGIELTVEVRLVNGESAFVNALKNIDGISDVTLVSYNGDYMA
ncbi:MAG: DUF4956 domain-containing protein [Clostridia bacterium]|nr:DUF4956 domain-containing protein [Clostridia bacterium]